MKGKNYLLIIAIDKYQNGPFQSLNNAKLDAERLIKVLTSKYDFELIQSPIFDEHGTRRGIVEAIFHSSNFLTSFDNIIIYFAGHGQINPKTKRGFWIPSDSTNLVSDFIPNSTIIEGIEAMEAKHVLVISDSCFSGSFLERTRDTTENFYNKIEQLQSRWVFASGSLEKVSDGLPGVGSPFSIALVNFLERNSANSVSFLELANNVSKETGNSTSQQPIIAQIAGVGHAGGQLIFKLRNENVVSIFDKELTRISISFETSLELQKLGFIQKSIFGFYKSGNELSIKKVDSSKDFICSAFIFDEISDFIPEELDVDTNTFLANARGYERLNIEDGEYVTASIQYQRTHEVETPFIAICRCKGRMVAFSVDKEGVYNNLITWGFNLAEAAGLMLIQLVRENKVKAI